MTEKEYNEQQKLLQFELEAVTEKIDALKKTYINSLNEPWKQYCDKMVKVKYHNCGITGSLIGYWKGISMLSSLLQVGVYKPKKDGSKSQRTEWAFFNDILSIEEI